MPKLQNTKLNWGSRQNVCSNGKEVNTIEIFIPINRQLGLYTIIIIISKLHLKYMVFIFSCK